MFKWETDDWSTSSDLSMCVCDWQLPRSDIHFLFECYDPILSGCARRRDKHMSSARPNRWSKYFVCAWESAPHDGLPCDRSVLWADQVLPACGWRRGFFVVVLLLILRSSPFFVLFILIMSLLMIVTIFLLVERNGNFEVVMYSMHNLDSVIFPYAFVLNLCSVLPVYAFLSFAVHMH